MGRPHWFIWTFSIVVHVELVVIAGALMGGEPEDLVDERADLHCAILQPPPVKKVELPRGNTYGRWPVQCDHRGRTLEMGDDRLGDGLRCESCGWPWWVIRGWPQN